MLEILRPGLERGYRPPIAARIAGLRWMDTLYHRQAHPELVEALEQMHPSEDLVLVRMPMPKALFEAILAEGKALGVRRSDALQAWAYRAWLSGRAEAHARRINDLRQGVGRPVTWAADRSLSWAPESVRAVAELVARTAQDAYEIAGRLGCSREIVYQWAERDEVLGYWLKMAGGRASLSVKVKLASRVLRELRGRDVLCSIAIDDAKLLPKEIADVPGDALAGDGGTLDELIVKGGIEVDGEGPPLGGG